MTSGHSVEFKSSLFLIIMLLTDKSDFQMNSSYPMVTDMFSIFEKQIRGLILVSVLTFAVRHYYGIWSKCQVVQNICKYFCKKLFAPPLWLFIHSSESRLTFQNIPLIPCISILSHKKCQKHFSKMSDVTYVRSGDFDSSTTACL